MHTGVLIVGGGLAGLALADHLHRAGVDFQLCEARERWGGRIKTAYFADAAFDLGPSWFWPGQARIAALVSRFDLRVVGQYSQGEIMAEDEHGQVRRGMGIASMEGSWRLAGGMQTLIDALVAGLPAERLQRSAPASRIARTATGMQITLADGRTFNADHVVLALPPRVAATLTFSPPLGPTQHAALEAIPTWMGGQAKLLACYDTPFWRHAGLSGDAVSRHGPLVEIHDASAPSGTPAALFGFVGVPVAARRDRRAALQEAALAQLVRLFGEAARTPRQLIVQDWAFAPESASPLDHIPLRSHPDYGLPPALRTLYDGHLHLASSEVADEFGGYLEGALSSAHTLAMRFT